MMKDYMEDNFKVRLQPKRYPGRGAVTISIYQFCTSLVMEDILEDDGRWLGIQRAGIDW